MDLVKKQYDRNPYPPIPVLALPSRIQNKNLSFEFGLEKAKLTSLKQVGARILVAGSGTFEPLVVAAQNPKAEEIIAVELSESSVNVLKKRLLFQKIKNGLLFFLPDKKLPKIKVVNADLMNWEDGSFDYIISTFMIHHVEFPDKLFKRLAAWLNPNGLMRLVTYPRQSRIWMRMAAHYFQFQGLSQTTPNLKKACLKAIEKLPDPHPVRSIFLSHPEIHNRASLIDAFFHSCEKPLFPIEWKILADEYGLTWLFEDQNETSQGKFLNELDQRFEKIDPWVKLQIMDDLLEICDNPVIWFQKKNDINKFQNKELPSFLKKKFTYTEKVESVYEELSYGVKRIEVLLKDTGIDVKKLLSTFKEEVGSRVHPTNHDQILPLLTLTEYSLKPIWELVRSLP